MRHAPRTLSLHDEAHRGGRAGWLRAAVLGSDDAIVSTASLMLGIAATAASKEAIVLVGIAGLAAGSMSMAVGEFVSVAAQRDAERADAEQLSRGDEARLAAHLRDELHIDVASSARPWQAAWISAASFAVSSLVPIAALLLAPATHHVPAIALVSLASLALLGALGGRLGGARMIPAAVRITVGGALAMGVTAVIGRLVGVAVR